MTTPNTPDWYDLVPKAELHFHLEGAIPLDALFTLVQKYGGDPLAPDLEALERQFAYRDFPHFLETWMWKNRFLREYDDFTFIAEAVARDLVRQNIRYVEAFFSPPDFFGIGLNTQELARAIRVGLARVPQVEVALVADLVRDSSPALAARTLAEVAEVRDLGVIGVGIGGAEQKHPPEPFAAVYAEARRLGLHTSAHAGEAAGPASVWGALRELKAERLGHGTHAVEDPALVEALAESQTPLELCPGSNVCTGSVAKIEDHPVRRYFERGLAITINTDDPKMFGNSLAGEYRQLERVFGFTRAEIRQLILAGVTCSWLPEARKAQLAAEFQADPNWAMGG